MILEHVDITDVGEGGMVGDHARQSDLRAALLFVEAEAQRMAHGILDRGIRNSRRPVRAHQVGMYGRDVQPRGIGGDFVGAHRLSR